MQQSTARLLRRLNRQFTVGCMVVKNGAMLDRVVLAITDNYVITADPLFGFVSEKIPVEVFFHNFRRLP